MQSDSQKLLVSSIRRLLRGGRSVQLQNIVDKAHPADLAHLFGSLTPAQRNRIMELISDQQTVADMLTELEPPVLEDVLEEWGNERIAGYLRLMHADDLTDILQFVGAERKDRLLAMLSTEEQSEATSLMGYDPESAGGLMSTDYFAVNQSTQADEALRLLQEDVGGEAEVIFYVYVVNDHEQLVGVASVRELVREPGETPLEEFMITDVIRVKVDTDQEEVARLVARYNLLALPVVEANNRLAGIVTVDDIIDVIRHEATEDMLLMAGAGEPDVSPNRSAFRSIRARVPWLMPSFIAGLLGVAVISAYEAQLIALIPLAAMIPMLMGVAGNAGLQSSTIVTRGMTIGKLDFVELGRVVLKELFIGLTCGVVYGALLGVLAGFFFMEHPALFDLGPLWFGLVCGASLAGGVGLAAVLGAAVPMVFEKLGFDPAVATGPFVTTAIDVLAVWLYLASAAALLPVV